MNAWGEEEVEEQRAYKKTSAKTSQESREECGTGGLVYQHSVVHREADAVFSEKVATRLPRASCGVVHATSGAHVIQTLHLKGAHWHTSGAGAGAAGSRAKCKTVHVLGGFVGCKGV